MNAVLFDYGAGNMHSLARAFAHVGTPLRVESDIARCIDVDLLVLPGVGAFGLAAERIAPARLQLRDALRAGLPCIGVCLGMQLLFEGSDEGDGRGLALLEGRVCRLTEGRVPHMGWAAVSGLADPMYFAHSYVCQPRDASVVQATTATFAAIVRTARTVGVQFHPEKSSKPGLALLDSLVKSVCK